jgi:predicted PurR-regulated permease PerM
VQAGVVHLSPVLTIFAAVIFGLLLGPIGVFLAAPLTISGAKSQILGRSRSKNCPSAV